MGREGPVSKGEQPRSLAKVLKCSLVKKASLVSKVIGKLA
jgi:hypothetical protein